MTILRADEAHISSASGSQTALREESEALHEGWRGTEGQTIVSQREDHILLLESEPHQASYLVPYIQASDIQQRLQLG